MACQVGGTELAPTVAALFAESQGYVPRLVRVVRAMYEGLEIFVCGCWGEGLWVLDFALCCVLLWDCKTARLGFCHFSFGSTLPSSPLTAPLPRAELLIVDADHAML